MKLIYIYWVTIKQILIAVRLSDYNLGDIVTYQRQNWMLVQGVKDPYWNIHRVSDNERLENIHKKEFKKQFSFRNVIHDTRSTWRFYSLNWHNIWKNSSIDEIKRSPIRGFYP